MDQPHSVRKKTLLEKEKMNFSDGELSPYLNPSPPVSPETVLLSQAGPAF